MRQALREVLVYQPWKALLVILVLTLIGFCFSRRMGALTSLGAIVLTTLWSIHRLKSTPYN